MNTTECVYNRGY